MCIRHILLEDSSASQSESAIGTSHGLLVKINLQTIMLDFMSLVVLRLECELHGN